jgi:hypothetical protein
MATQMAFVRFAPNGEVGGCPILVRAFFENTCIRLSRSFRVKGGGTRNRVLPSTAPRLLFRKLKARERGCDYGIDFVSIESSLYSQHNGQ